MALTTRADHERPAPPAAEGPSASPAIETRELRKVYGQFEAVKGLSISVGRGEVFGFLGPNGAGKSTVVKMLTGLARPTSGTASLLGHPRGARAAHRRLGYLPELFRFHDWLTAWEFLDTHGKLYRMSGDERKRRIPEVLELVGLYERRNDRLRTFSKGMQQRAGLAQALLHEPDLVFLDEPTSALDPLGRRVVRDVISSLRDAGTTVFLNSHLLSEVEMVCDRVAIINRGELIAIGPLKELLHGSFVVSLRVGNWSEDLHTVALSHGDLADLRVDDANVAELTIELPDETAIPVLVERLIAAGGAVYEVSPLRRGLEDYFVGLVDQSDGLDVRR